jgi:Lactate dehydrogenase and related dehydrogenases
MKIVVLDGYTLNPGDLTWDGLKGLGELTVYDRTPVDMILERAGNAEIVFTNKTLLTRETHKKMAGVKYIGVLATGYNVVDTEAAKELGIAVTNIPTYGTAAVAQMISCADFLYLLFFRIVKSKMAFQAHMAVCLVVPVNHIHAVTAYRAY